MLCFAIDESDPPSGISAWLVLTSSGAMAFRSAPTSSVKGSMITCQKRADGPAGLAVVWSVPGCGQILLETSRLIDRDKPYNLPLELVRGRLMRINQKREDWGLFDFDGFEPIAAEIDKARDLFIEAVKADDFGRAAPHRRARPCNWPSSPARSSATSTPTSS